MKPFFLLTMIGAICSSLLTIQTLPTSSQSSHEGLQQILDARLGTLRERLLQIDCLDDDEGWEATNAYNEALPLALTDLLATTTEESLELNIIETIFEQSESVSVRLAAGMNDNVLAVVTGAPCRRGSRLYILDRNGNVIDLGYAPLVHKAFGAEDRWVVIVDVSSKIYQPIFEVWHNLRDGTDWTRQVFFQQAQLIGWPPEVIFSDGYRVIDFHTIAPAGKRPCPAVAELPNYERPTLTFDRRYVWKDDTYILVSENTTANVVMRDHSPDGRPYLLKGWEDLCR